MQTLEVKDFSAGYIPSDDAVSGKKNGLLRMTNVQLDSANALTLTRGTSKLNNSQFSASVHSLYSRQLGNTKFRYVGLADGSVLRDDGSGNYSTTIVTDGGPAATIKAAFGSLFNNTMVVAGATRVKDNGTNVYNLGVAKPTEAVTVSAGTSPEIGISDSYVLTATEGTITSSDTAQVTGDTNEDTFRFEGYRTFAAPRNLMDYGGGLYGRDDDKIYISFRCPDSSLFVSFKVTFYFHTVDGTPDGTPDFLNYYEFVWDRRLDDVIRDGLDQWSVFQIERSEFFRYGPDNTKNWTNVIGVRFSALFSTAVTDLVIATGSYVGSSKGPLNGTFDYIQVNVGNNGAYVAKSTGGPALNIPLQLNNGFAIVTPQDPTALDPQINEVWIYRRKSDAPGSDPLGRYLRVKQIALVDIGPFNDLVDDATASEINEPLNQFLLDVQDDIFDDDIYAIEVNYFERTLYMSPRNVWISEKLNPDAVDLRYTVKISGDAAEENLWMIKAGPSTLLLGTTKDIYSFDGTLNDLPDGTIDVTIRPLGIKQPPIEDCVCLYKNTLFYIGTDGLNALTGSANTLYNGALDLLWRRYDRFGQQAFYKSSANKSNYDLAVAGAKLFIQVTLADTSRTLMVYDFQRQYWYNYLLSAACLHTEEDDVLTAGFADGSDFYARIIDVGNTFDYSSDGQQVFLRFPIYDDSLPLNRKDSYTLKLKIDTGGKDVSVRLYKDSSASYIDYGTVQTSGGVGEVAIDIYGTVGLAKQYQLELVCAATNQFKLEEWSIEYDPRPKQTLFLRIPPNNYETAGRKRIPAIPFVIDTLGVDVTFTPILDGVAQTTSTVNTGDKQVYNHYFTSDKAAYTIGGTLQGSAYFEYYDLVQPRIVEVLPDPAKYFVIPPLNLGTQCRKRIVAVAMVIDTKGVNVTFTPIVDGTSLTPSTINTTRKRTYIHYFTSNIEGTDISGILSGGTEFEFYGILEQECISEKMPIPTEYLVIPANDYGTPNRKRHSSYKFVINTRGSNVTFTPKIDGTTKTPLTFSTSEKRTIEYFFDADTIGIDIGGTLSGTNPFEFYGPIRPQTIETLPDRLDFLVIPENNFGIAAKKRIATLPMVINTNGHDVTFTPYVDNVARTSSTFNTPNKQTVLHYFDSFEFGIDFKGILDGGANPFEFYEMLKPEDIQVLPVGKKIDQVGPLEFLKLGKILLFRVRLVAEGTSLTYRIFDGDNNQLTTGTITTIVNADKVYEVRMVKGISANIAYVEFSSSDIFHRYYARFLVNLSGGESESKWMMFGSDPDQKLK